jgi:multidrug transporter EmrE-like cation transporter
MDSYFYVFIAIVLTVYGQIIIKSRALLHTADGIAGNYSTFLVSMFSDAWVLSAFVAAVVAAAVWMLAIRNANLSLLYPFMASTFILVPLFAAFFFGEKISVMQFAGLLMIVGGVSLATIAR